MDLTEERIGTRGAVVSLQPDFDPYAQSHFDEVMEHADPALDELWAELKAESFLHADAPVPGS